MSEATLEADGNRTTVRLARRLADPPTVVWRALTEREQLRSWFPCDVVVAGGQWNVGATISFVFPPEVMDMTLTGEVLVAEESRRLAFRWGEEILRFELTESDGGTCLVLFDELPPAVAARNAAGWDICLDRLSGIAPGPAAWQSRFDTYSLAFERVVGPQEGPPADHKG